MNRVLNLIDKNKSDIGWKVDRYPDGQIQLVLDKFDNKGDLVIISSIKSSDDLFILAQLADIINRRGLYVVKLVIPYLLSSRTDRLFSDCTAFTLKIVADVVNSFNSERVELIDAHSPMSLRLIRNSVDVFNPIEFLSNNHVLNHDDIIIAPDEGAKTRLSKFNPSNPIVSFRKYRDESGKVAGFELVESIDLSRKSVIVIDDLCDGGATFRGISNELYDMEVKSKSLYITHSIQPNAVIELSEKYYDKVYTTNTFMQMIDSSSKLTQFDIDKIVCM